MTGDGLDLLKPFLPGLEAALDDPDVSEIMINGPGNVWLEGHGRLRPIAAPSDCSHAFLSMTPTARASAGLVPAGMLSARTRPLSMSWSRGGRWSVLLPAVRLLPPCVSYGSVWSGRTGTARGAGGQNTRATAHTRQRE